MSLSKKFDLDPVTLIDDLDHFDLWPWPLQLLTLTHDLVPELWPWDDLDLNFDLEMTMTKKFDLEMTLTLNIDLDMTLSLHLSLKWPFSWTLTLNLTFDLDPDGLAVDHCP